MSSKKIYFWNLKNQTFGGRKFGTDVTDLLGDDEDRIKRFLELGQIVTSEPTDFDQAKENELGSLRVTVEKLQLRNKELESEAKKSASVKLKESREKIKDLESQLDEATDPKKQGLNDD